MTMYNRIASFAKKTFASVATVAALAAGTAAFAAPTIYMVQPLDWDTVEYAKAGDQIDVLLYLTGDGIEDVTVDSARGGPYITLNVLNANTGDKTTAQAPYVDYDPDEGALLFTYTVKPGDTIDVLDVKSFTLNGAAIQTVNDGRASAITTQQSLPKGDNPDSLASAMSISIHTIGYTDGTNAKTGAAMKELDEMSFYIGRGDKVAALQDFTVSCEPEGAVAFASSFAIPANEAQALFTFTAAQASTDPVTITIHPNINGLAATDTYADITYTIPSIAPGPSPFVFLDSGAPTYTFTTAAALAAVNLPITRNGSTALDQAFTVTVESGAEHLKAPVPTSFSIPKDATTATFTVTPAEATTDPIVIRLHPAGYTGDASDLVLTMQPVAAGSVPYIFTQTGDVAYTIDGVKELDELEVLISRQDGSSNAQTFTITAINGNCLTKPASFVLPAGEDIGILRLTANDMTGSPVILTLHPAGFTGTSYDLVLTIPQISAAAAQKILLSKLSNVEEGSGNQTLTVTLPVAPKSATTVTLTVSDTSKMAIQGASSFEFAAGDIEPWEVTLRPLDGNADVTITATPSGAGAGAYQVATRDVSVINANPVLNSPVSTPDKPWDAGTGGEGFPKSVSWSGKDVAADVDTLYAIVDWGDGTSDRYDGKTGSGSHIYEAAGTFGITITMYDKDGGAATVAGTVEITPAVNVLINEYKYKLDTDVGQNAYKGLQGLGRGSILSGIPGTTRTTISPDIDFQYKFSQSQTSVPFTATPESFTITEKDNEGNPVDRIYDSFFHVWIGECFASPYSIIPVAPVSAIVNMGDGQTAQSQNIGGVFARERYPEDGCADIDYDGLPDDWEKNYFGVGSEDAGYPFEDITGDYGANGNPDNDFLPAGAVNNEKVVYPLKGGYAPNGLAYNNLYEVRGFHHGLNKLPDAFGWAEPSFADGQDAGDEPHQGKFDDSGNYVDTDGREFYGTDPTSADSDGDGYLDGYEYYWWRVITEAMAGALEDAKFEMYDPTKVIEGTPLSLELAFQVFHPLVPAKTGEGFDDLDGDGLSNYEEMLLGTNPLNWDTDGDRMNDGWEVMWGLDPFNDKDGSGNPDGDFMAACGASTDAIELRHSEVYKAFGFDARTAWNQKYKNRHRKYVNSDEFSYAPNTLPFTNFEEYYLARWSIDKGITTAVEPMSKEFMTQPVPDTQVSYFTHGGMARPVLNEGAYSTDNSNSVVSAGAKIDIPPSKAIFQTVIATHGCDSDNDGMPDGWELYLCCGEENEIERQLWPTGEGWNQDASFACDFDELSNIQECHSTELCEYYAGIYSNFAASATSDINHNVNGTWYNKWWPTDPWNSDTDWDGLSDSQENEKFRYCEEMDFEQMAENFGSSTMNRGHIPGAGLNPCSVDTDMDYLPDFFEFQYAGFNRNENWAGGYIDQPGTFGDAVNGVVYGGGMDGTYFDSRNGYDEVTGEERGDFDFDHDGLQNYQEYWINGMFHFQYDKWQQGLDYGDYDPQQIFATGPFAKQRQIGVYWKPVEGGYVAMPMSIGDVTFDWAYFAENWQLENGQAPNINPFTGDPIFPFFYMPPESRPAPFGPLAYAAADPRLADSDADNMDDYYEMFHGLNPILSDTYDICNQVFFRPPDVYDFNKCPWLAGMPNADPDQDGMANWEESISPNQPNSANHNTDPSPLWFTDISWTHSFVNLYYNFGSAANYWAPEGQDVYEYYPDPGMMWGDARPNYLFSFEMNEGFDTDNDNLSDTYEINGTSGGVTDPLDSDRPVGRKALYLDGEGAARTRGLCAFGKNALRSWTLEAWVRPEEPASGSRQIVIDRPVTFEAGSSTPVATLVRHTFILGIEGDGCPFVEFDSGSDNKITECAKAGNGFALEADKWYHIAATFDGFQGKLRLYVDGRLAATKATSAIPYTGFTYSSLNGVSGDAQGYAGGETNRINLAGAYSSPRWSPIVIGARDDNPVGKVDGGYYYSNGNVFKLNSQPVLKSYFKGWIDEVRIWTGARPGGEDAGDQRVQKWGWPTIKSDFDALKRYGFAEVLKAREDTVKYFQRVLDLRIAGLEAKKGNSSGTTSNNVTTTTTRWFEVDGMTFDEYYDFATSFLQLSGGEDATCRVPPQLLCCYNFDNLPDPDYEPVMPSRFASLNGRPATYSGAPWWRYANDRTTVYTGAEAPYCYQNYIENLVATMPLGYLVKDGADTEYQSFREDTVLPLYKFRANRVVNSKFWTRDAKGGIPNSEIPAYGENGMYFENNFKNTSNPYGLYYITSNSSAGESHPTLMAQETFDPIYAVMYNHLLPLRSARADMSVQLWDDPNGTGLGVNSDSDGDGLPDYWELANGMDPYNRDQNGNGIDDRFDDFDADGLSNFAEWKAGVNPYMIDTDGNGIPDYEDSSDATARMNGVAYTDNDYLDDKWEQQWNDNYASTTLYDEHLDRDLDGWDNWSEQLFTYELVSLTSDETTVVRGTRIDDPRVELMTDDDGTWYGRNYTEKGMYKAMEWYPIDRLDVANWDETKFIATSEVQYALTRPTFVPVPNIDLTISYNNGLVNPKFGYWVSGDGKLAPTSFQFYAPSEATLVVYVYSDRAMPGLPDAIYQRKITNNGLWPLNLTLTRQDLTYGHVRQGRNWFFAFVNFDGTANGELGAGDATWPLWDHVTTGSAYPFIEPAGINDDFVEGIDIGWDKNSVRVVLTDDLTGYLRWSWETSNPAKTDAVRHVEIQNTWGTSLFSKDISDARPWLTEADIIDFNAKANGNKNFGLATKSGDAVDGSVYFINVDGVDVAAYTNFFPTLAAPTLLSPVNGIVYGARPEFKFRLPTDATEFDFELRRGSANGTLIYSGRHLAPGRAIYDSSNYDLVQWQFPYCVGDVMPNGTRFDAGNEAYYWKVKAYGVHNKTGVASAVQNFRVATSANAGKNGDKGVIRVDVRYPGMAAFANGGNPYIRVQAFESASFNGKPAAEVSLTGTEETAVLCGLEVGDYYIRAFVDQDGNYNRSNWESWGYYRNENGGDQTYVPLATHAALLADAAPVTVTIRDADTDNDCLPDALEYVMYKASKGSVPADNAIWGFSQSWLSLSGPGEVISSPGYTDFDNDGLNDLAELNYGSDLFCADSNGDGVNDRLARDLGFKADEAHALKITSFSTNPDGTVAINWEWEGFGSTAKSSAKRGSEPATATTLASEVTYVIEYKESLADPEWKPIDVTSSIQTTGESCFDAAEKKSGFFRVRIYTE